MGTGMLPSDRELVLRAARGDFDALSELLEAHGPEIHRHLAGRFGDRLRSVLDVEDVMQVTYLEAFLRITHFVPEGSGSFAGWLRRIAMNNLRDAVREARRSKRPQLRRRVEFISDSSSVSAFVDGVIGESTTPSRKAASHEQENLLKDVISKLPEDYRRVVELCDIQGKSTSETAALLSRSQGAVCMLRVRAHDRLRELLGSSSRFFSDSD